MTPEPVVTIVIPVGPRKEHAAYLEEAIASAENQTVEANILIVDDMHGLPILPHPDGLPWGLLYEHPSIEVWRSPWRLGVAHAFNFGVALAATDFVLFLGADDTLQPDAVECVLRYSNWDAPEVRDHTYYSLPLRYMDTGEIQFEACGAAAVSKGLWRNTGGFPPQAASGASDAAFLSQIWNRPDFLRKSVADHAIYNYRRHAGSDTSGLASWQGVILETRHLLTLQFEPYPQWGRFQ